MKRIGYIYRTTNLINGKIYIGQHQRDEFDSKYYGSGVIFQKALKKYGKPNFKVEALLWVATVEKLNEAEIKFISAFDSTNKTIGYNLSTGGESGNKGVPMSDEQKKGISERQKGKQLPGNATMKAAAVNRGSHFSEESKRKMSIASMGKKGTRNGMTHTEEAKKKISESNKGKHSVPMSEETKAKLKKHWKGKPWGEKRRAAYERSKLELLKEAQ
jgi:group I intron endonuclease